jgi:surface protein
MAWEQHFTLHNIDGFETYEYTDKEVVSLPKNLQQPPGHCVSFRNCRKLTDISPLRNWDARKLTSLNRLFYGCSELRDISPLAFWNTCNVTNMVRVFNECYKLSDLRALSLWDVSKVTDMNSMIVWCSVYNITPLKQWKLNGSVMLPCFCDVYHTKPNCGSIGSSNTTSMINDRGTFQYALSNYDTPIVPEYSLNEQPIRAHDLSLELDVSSLTIPARRSIETQTEPPKGLLSRILGL